MLSARLQNTRFAVFLILSALCLPVQLQAQSSPAPPVSEMQLRPGDIVRITVWRQPEMSGEFPVTADGRIAHPLYREISVTGRSLRDVETQLGQFLQRYVENPQFVMEPLMRVSVSGQVDSPSMLIVSPGTTAAEAVAQAGGVTEQGRIDRVRLARQQGQRYLDLSNPRDGGIQLQSGDAIYVSTRSQWFRNVVLPVATIVGAVTSIVIAVRRDF